MYSEGEFIQTSYLDNIRVLSFFLKRDTWETLTKCDVLLICHDNDRGYLYDSKQYAQYLDSFGELLRKHGLKTESVAKPFSRYIGDTSYGNPVSINRVRLKILLESLIFNFLGISNTNGSWGDEFKLEKLWMKVIQKSNPKALICIQPEKSLCRAGRALNVPTYDLQHGVIDDDNPFYGEKYKSNDKKSNHPQGFLCWNELSASVIRKWTSETKITVDVVGNPWLDRFIKPKSGDNLVQQGLSNQFFMKTERPTIVVSLHRALQRKFSKNNPDSLKAIRALELTIQATGSKYNWLLRLHPVQLNGSQSKVVKKYLNKMYGRIDNVEWEQSSLLPLPLILSWADLHITHHSSVTIDASLLGVQTALIAPYIFSNNRYPELFKTERKQGTAQIVPSDHLMIENWIETKLGEGTKKLKPYDYVDNSTENKYLNFIGRIQ